MAVTELEEASRINGEARTQALKSGFLILSCLSLLALIPCGWLSPYRPGDLPVTASADSSKST